MRSEVDPRLTDLVLAIAMALVLAVVVAADPASRGAIGGYAFAVGLGVLLIGRRRLPRLLLIVTVLAIFAYYTLDLPPIGMVLPAVGALFSAAEQRRTLWAIGAAAVLLGVATYFRLDGSEPDSTLNGYTFVTEVALAAAAIALGAAVRLAREARERTAQIAALTASEAALAAEGRMQAERLRMARDLHDTIGHTLSVAALHAGVASEAIDEDETRAAIDQVRAATADALRELRRTVKVLRDDREPDPAPVLGLASLDVVADAARAAGLQVDVDLRIAPDALTRSADAAAFRIVQESVTNVLRHARATSVSLTIRDEDGALTIRVADDGQASGVHGTPGAGTPGAGIRGMKERAELLGGTLEAQPSPSGFVVTARIPNGAA
ncbi:Sensor histidine kinase DesK [Microbacterium hydrocarbonoxydans]|uniref:histidine kinase n=1 Tax=Microbacterium hydrocarbonoxydans TaxID=273678 RepID=A0A0M2HTX1_9MICO|nr:sensor histidine kinase [Microbacterium hydrocarbonoxydans]KJL48365.1 Sensor histidine kinase DesK [Microbacterium hydrocarbonoxydans]